MSLKVDGDLVEEYCDRCGELIRRECPAGGSFATFACFCENQGKIERPEDWITDHWTATAIDYGILEADTIE